MHEDADKLAAGDLHELMRCWEMRHRLWTVESHCRHIHFRKESRFPGFYYKADQPGTDDTNCRKNVGDEESRPREDRS
jgi:adenylylsulfate reductase subunit A